MSDLTDDNPLFSQDDIDKLLSAQSIEGVKEEDFNIEEDAGELSQDDIDRLLNSASASEDAQITLSTTPEKDDTEEDDDIDLGEISQDDIERLLNSASASEDAQIPASSAQKDTEAEVSDLGELSQDDIDKMLNDQIHEESDNSAQDQFEEDGGVFDLVSQDDIDKLMATDQNDEPLLPDSIADIGIDDPASNIISSEEELIDPSEALNIQDCLITQDTIDILLDSNNQNGNIPDDGQFGTELEPGAEDPFQVNLSLDDPDTEFALDGNDDITGSDLDNLLSDSPEDMEDLLNDISQDDIDGFLDYSDDQANETKGAEAGDEDSVRNVISQDDIDALLAGTDEEDEDILADMEMDEDLKGSATALRKVETPLPEDDDAQVVLEEPDESTTLADGTVRQLADLMAEEQKSPVKRSFLIKLTLILFLVVTLIVGCVAGAYFLFFKDKVDQLVPFSQPAVNTVENKDGQTAVPDMNIKESQELTPGTITLDNFMVLTSDRKDGINYVSVDISINYSYSKAFDAINDKLPYYRGVIYDAIADALKSDKGDSLTESDLLEIVKNAFNKALPDIKVDKIVFVNFKTG